MSAEPLELNDLVEHWTLLDGDRELTAGKRGGGRLAFALMLKFYARHGRFPDGHADLPSDVVEFVARQVQVAPETMRGYEFAGRTTEYHRAQIRRHFGFRECTVEDARGLERWLGEHVAEADPCAEVVRDELLDRCRRWRVEPPSEGRVERIIRAAIHGAQTALCQRIVARLTAESITRIEQLLVVADAGDDATESVLSDQVSAGQHQPGDDARRDREARGGPRGRAADGAVLGCDAAGAGRLAPTRKR